MYKADLDPKDTFQRMQDDPQAVMIDVRTQAEWAYVGGPAVERLIRLSWQVFPEMQVNESFVEQLDQANLPRDTQIFLLCRSGVRSDALKEWSLLSTKPDWAGGLREIWRPGEQGAADLEGPVSLGNPMADHGLSVVRPRVAAVGGVHCSSVPGVAVGLEQDLDVADPVDAQNVFGHVPHEPKNLVVVHRTANCDRGAVDASFVIVVAVEQ